MNKRFKLLAFIGLLCFQQSVVAMQSYGYQALQSQMLNNINHSGMLKLEQTNVSEETIVNGFLKAKKSKLNKLTVNGDVDLDNVDVNGQVTINGKMTTEDTHLKDTVTIRGQILAEDSKFEKEINLYGNHSEFENCNLKNITLQKTSDNETLHLYLEETHVEGDIVFKHPGVVHMDKESSIGGQVEGGKVEVS